MSLLGTVAARMRPETVQPRRVLDFSRAICTRSRREKANTRARAEERHAARLRSSGSPPISILHGRPREVNFSRMLHSSGKWNDSELSVVLGGAIVGFKRTADGHRLRRAPRSIH